MKKTITTCAMAMLVASNLCAQKESKDPTLKVVSDIKLSGYLMTQYQYSSQDGAESNTFNLRMARISLEGRILKDFYWKTQIQFNGNTSTLGNSPRVVDIFTEWQKYKYFKVKFGQFKNPFTFENPMNPIDQGFMGYAQNVQKLAGFSDRAGAHSSNGRDIGLQFQGDFLPNSNGRNLLHYQVGIFNGQGINTKDVDNQKNIIGGIWVMPVAGMRIGAFGWTGSYARKGTWNDDDNAQKQYDANGELKTFSGVRSLQQRRYAFSAEYVVDDWTFRSEYVHSKGKAFAKSIVNTNDASASNCNLSTNGDEAQGVYALVIAPLIKKKFHAKARYDMYQPTGDTSKMKTFYELGLDYNFTRNLTISAEYAYVNDRSLTKENYSMADFEVSVRF